MLALAVAIQLLLQHSNADYRVGPARYVLALNEGHRFHHLKWAGVGDVNFGLFTLIWDHLMHTHSYDPTRRFDSTQLGIAAKPHFPSGYLQQMRYPFTAGGRCDSASAATPSSPAVTGTRARLSVPSTNGVRLAAARACMAVMPGTTTTSRSGTAARTCAAR